MLAGCHHSHDPEALWQLPFGGAPAAPTVGPVAGSAHPPRMPTANPLRVPGVDREFLWNQLVDTVDDYFQIDSERRVQSVGGVLTEGQIETHFLPGATVFEPWRWDSASDYELSLATLQSLRRRASIRVVPVGNGYDVYVTVLKDLEDADFSAQATPGSSLPRHDGALMRTDRPRRPPQVTLGWIPQGRDFALEQELLQELYARLFQAPTPSDRAGFFP